MAYTEYAGTDITLYPGPGGSANADTKLKLASDSASRKQNVFAFTVTPIESEFITTNQMLGLYVGTDTAGLFIPAFQEPIQGTIVGSGQVVRPTSGFIYPRREE